MLFQKSSQPRFEEPQIIILRRKNALINFQFDYVVYETSTSFFIKKWINLFIFDLSVIQTRDVIVQKIPTNYTTFIALDDDIKQALRRVLRSCSSQIFVNQVKRTFQSCQFFHFRQTFKRIQRVYSNLVSQTAVMKNSFMFTCAVNLFCVHLYCKLVSCTPVL